jgi:diadenosine tetraphosphate (Ap4A) HIT family hydrolase
MTSGTKLNPTLARFEYPNLLVRDYERWAVVLRRHQPTLGALVLINKSDALAWPDVGPEAFADLSPITTAIERCLRAAFNYDKINYLMLMMVDPNVHFHVFPRYGRDVSFEGVVFKDHGWPKAPDIASGPLLDDHVATKLIDRLKARWSD